MDSLEIKPHKELTDLWPKAMQWRQDSLFIIGAERTRHIEAKNKSNYKSFPFTYINSNEL